MGSASSPARWEDLSQEQKDNVHAMVADWVSRFVEFREDGAFRLKPGPETGTASEPPPEAT